MAEGPKGKTFLDHVTDAGIRVVRTQNEVTSQIGKAYKHFTGADHPHHEGPGAATRTVEGFNGYGKRAQGAIGAPTNDKLAHDVAANQKLLHSGVDPALKFVETHIGSKLDTLADPHSTPFECAKAMSELRKELTPKELASNVAKAVIEHKVGGFIAKEEAQSKSFEADVHKVETAKGGIDQAKHLKKDLAEIKTELAAMKKALHDKDYGSLVVHSAKLGEKMHALKEDLGKAQEFAHKVKGELRAATHPHGHGAGGNLHMTPAMNKLLAGPTEAATVGSVAPGANVTPLSGLREGDHASIGRQRDGSFSVQSHPTPSHHHQPALTHHAGR